MDPQLLAQLKTWNPWWQGGAEGIERYKDPVYKRELYNEVLKQVERGDLIVSIVGMRQVGKSTIMRQMMRKLLADGIDPRNILYVSFDDPYLRVSYDQKRIFEEVIRVYAEHILGEDIAATTKELYFFFDEIHQLPDWEKSLKSYFDRRFSVRYVVSGSSSLRLQSKNRESLLGRISEHTLWPFSFREYVEYRAMEEKDTELLSLISLLRAPNAAFMATLKIAPIFPALENAYTKLYASRKQSIIECLKRFILDGGFPRVWQQPDLASKQRTLWEQHVAKVLFEDLPQIAKIRKVKDLEFLYVRIVDFNAKEAVLSQLQKDLHIHWDTLNRYLDYLLKTYLIFRVDRTKSKRSERKRRSGNVKFYVTDIALSNALRRRTEEVYDNPDEMSYISENLVCTALKRWISGPQKDEQVVFYKDASGEVDFVFKDVGETLPIEVKWRNDVPTLKALDKLCKKWALDESMVITKDFDLTYRNGRLSIPLWFFLLAF